MVRMWKFGFVHPHRENFRSKFLHSSLCSLCLCVSDRFLKHRGTENTEEEARRWWPKRWTWPLIQSLLRDYSDQIKIMVRQNSKWIAYQHWKNTIGLFLHIMKNSADLIDDSEKIGRFIFSQDHFNSISKVVKYAAFLLARDNKALLKLSAFGSICNHSWTVCRPSIPKGC